VYAVDAATGALRWRYPSTDRGLDGIVLAPPALSPDGSTVYVGTAWGPTVDFDAESAGSIYAINVGSGEASWVYQPVDHSLWWEPWAWMQRLAVGSDGTLWVAASMYTVDAGQAVIFALADAGDHATALQESWTQLDATGQWALGLALDESAGETWRVVVGTSSAPVLGAYRDLGAITAIDPATRGVEWQFYPQDASLSGGVTGVSLDANGNTFATVSGNSDVGHVIMLDVEGQLVWNVGLGGLAEWGSPSIGPDGTVYVADTRQCALRGFPIEDGLCDGVNITPVVYGIRGETVPLDTGRQDEIPANPVGEEECACGTALPRGLGLMPAGWAVLRRRRG
jgi:outer membrane protein assembly factor BamB